MRPLRISEHVLRAPSTFRAWVRASELGLIGVAALIGILGGAAVTAMGLVAQAMHEGWFGLPSGTRLSGIDKLGALPLALVPALGGLALAGIGFLVARWRKRVAIDPIEANALHGGRMSLRDSLVVVAQNLASNGFGASVGLEAGYTQVSAAIASRFGQALETRRNDLRLLVGCGAAAAIAAAFDAPLTGAFYAFELIVGTYSIVSLGPVVTAALCGTVAGRLLGTPAGFVDLGGGALTVGSADYPLAFLLGIASAGLGVAIMQSVTGVETLVRRLAFLPAALRPALGGLCVGGLALVSPQVLSSGHGALHLDLEISPTIAALALIIALKSLASIVSLGSGFRGGLFFASLLIGALFGNLFANLVHSFEPALAGEPLLYALVGMSALAVTVIGGPLTMTFLALEASGDFPATTLVLVAVLAASVTARRTFGYTFATWRFHLRGETIRSAHDIGWIRTLTVGQMMRPDVRTVRDDMTLEAFRRDFPLGSTQRVVVVDNADRYAGIVLVADAHGSEADAARGAERIAGVLRYGDQFLLPQMNAKEAAAAFDRAESEALAVLHDAESRRVIGLLTESHTLRRYSEELDMRRGELAGEIGQSRG